MIFAKIVNLFYFAIQAIGLKKVIIYLMTLSLCHSERSEESRYHKVGVTEILPPYGRLNDTLC